MAPPRAASSPATTDAIYSIAAHGVIPGPLPGSGEYLGSGCTPASDALPDGIWFGLVRGAGEGAIGLDLACFRWIDDPADAIEPGGWGVDNSGPEVWSVPVASGTAVTCQPSDCPQPYMAYAAWAQLTRDYLDAHPEAAMWIEGNDFGIMVWLYVNGGRTTEIVEPVLGG
ncbi:MAG: hypothetical protein QNJ77_02680 [Acidimicrobiia bacterium]|nr:hypothetical protein [Acidimicrobiia bacterium]